ncbi:uncharacterized protein N7459_006775 [Penicillium hispanicum]|uniref:uncharacterized protein n=1 Tax=Penicillium hispanicum TaxID=1080232 RepID=UPI00254133C0|nr:uncharacterized protein N7459_006775 [Penicillium hispanicum]KAJ5577811.1 hypothetical protein N7459_006775 [Penicillium hispanicum]
MSNPLSPLSSSYQNARARSPKTASSPFLTKTLEEPSAPEHSIPSSPLKKPWTATKVQNPDIFNTDENCFPNEHDENNGTDDNNGLEEAVSSPFRYEGHEETVDFQKLQYYQQETPTSRHEFPIEEHEEPMSSPFRPEGRDETVDFQKLREVQPLSPSFTNRLALENTGSSPFRPEGRDDTVDFEKFHEMHPESPAFDEQPMRPESSPLRQGQLGEINELQDLRGVQRDSIETTKQSPAGARSSPFKPNAEDDMLNMQKSRSVPRASLGLDQRRESVATPRKRSYDQTPQDHGDNAEMNERCKKGMTTRAEGPEIHVDIEEESSVIHNRSLDSTASTTHDRSTIANSMMEDKRNEGMSTVLHDDDDGLTNKENLENQENADDDAMLGGEDHDPMDDTGFSNFSVLPDMTSFARLRAESPLKSMRSSVAPSPAPSHRRSSVNPATPSTARRSYRHSALLDVDSPIGSPTPRRRGSRDIGNPSETQNLLDFTDQVNFFPRHSMQQSALFPPSRRSPMRNLRQSIRSPSKLSLLDFDIPPAPTPRSIPTVTPRELESLKSGFMSEISSLKATLSGKEAEVASLKQAVADAERRVGEALEEVRNEAARKDELEIEQAEWERRGKDMERVLQSVRDELMEGERERDRLTRKAEEAEKSKEQLEGRIVELETQLSAARSTTSAGSSSTPGSRHASQSAEDTAREVQDAVEKVARELHTLYKSKHETKVAALKKSYESRWEKRVREAEHKLTTAREENERLRGERDAVQSESVAAANASLISRENDDHEAEKRVLEAQIKGLQREMAALKEDREHLHSELKSERAEKGELVAVVDEWLAMQHNQSAAHQQEREISVSSAGYADDEIRQAGDRAAENLRHSTSRSGSSGIRPPATAEKKITRYGATGGHSRGNSGGKSGIAVFTPGRGGIMSSIERMGRGGA